MLPAGALIGLFAAAVTGYASEPGLTVSDAWMRAVVPSRPAAGYFTLSNDTARSRTLVRAESSACGVLMLHRSVHQGGQDRMEMVKSIPVPAHGAVTFAPGGYHLMCMSPSTEVTPGHSIDVTLTFDGGDTVKASFAVRGAASR